MTGDLLAIRSLSIRRVGKEDAPFLVEGVDLSVSRGEILGIVGETGAGKTLSVRALLGSLPAGLVASTAGASFDDAPIMDLELTMQRLRGDRIGIVVQDPAGALLPTQTVGKSVATILRTHRSMSKEDAFKRVVDMFGRVGLVDPNRVAKMRPYQLSGGMAQRVLIATALITDPDLIVADEPTTALDVTVQWQILSLLKDEVLKRNAGAIIITHDIGVVAQACTHVAVLYQGTLREYGTTSSVLSHPQDPYTIELLKSLPKPTDGSLASIGAGPGSPSDGAPVAEAQGVATPAAVRESIVVMSSINKTFHGTPRPVLRDIDLALEPGRTIAIVGESGAGKSTLLRSLLRLTSVDSGRLVFRGEDITDMSAKTFRTSRRDIQVVYQNPTSALDPRMSIRHLIEEPLKAFPECAPGPQERNSRVNELMESVRLDPEFLDRFPRHLSGGQKQRVAIARALATKPKVVVLDEPTASLDMSVRRHVVTLLADLQRDLGVAYILVSHDFNTVRSLADRVVVLYLGEVVEDGPADDVLKAPRHPYTQALLAAELSAVPGAQIGRWGLIPEPSAVRPPQLNECPFAPRCPMAIEACSDSHPDPVMVGPSHMARCIRIGDQP